jgi:hypothetical protein
VEQRQLSIVAKHMAQWFVVEIYVGIAAVAADNRILEMAKSKTHKKERKEGLFTEPKYETCNWNKKDE